MTAIDRRLPRLLACIALFAFPFAAFGHRLDEYLQATLVAIEPGEVRLQINLTPGVAVAEQVLALIDLNHDGVISTNEVAAYAELLKRDLTVRLDQRDVELKLTAFNCPAPAELRSGLGIIQIEFSVKTGPFEAGAHRLTLENRHLPAISVYLVNAARPNSVAIRITAQQRNDNQSTGRIEFGFHPAANSTGVFRIAALFIALAAAIFVGLWPRGKARRVSDFHAVQRPPPWRIPGMDRNQAMASSTGLPGNPTQLPEFFLDMGSSPYGKVSRWI